MTINERVNTIITELYNGNKRAFSIYIGVSPTVIENVVGTRQGKPSYDVLKKICAKANISGDWLLTGDGPMLKSEDISSTDKQPPKTQSTSSDDGYFDRLLHRIEELSAENAILKADLEQIRSSVDNVDSDTSALAV